MAALLSAITVAKNDRYYCHGDGVRRWVQGRGPAFQVRPRLCNKKIQPRTQKSRTIIIA